jgi:hypothetical protein
MYLILTFLVLFSGISQPPGELPSKLLKEIRKNYKKEVAEWNVIQVHESAQSSAAGYFLSLQFTSGIERQYAYVGRVNTCRAGGCSVGKDSDDLVFEYFEYFILFDAAGKIILTGIHNYQASHGQEISARGWLRQFRGHQAGKTLEVGRQVDAIAGATISVHAITDDIGYRAEQLGKWLSGKDISKK